MISFASIPQPCLPERWISFLRRTLTKPEADTGLLIERWENSAVPGIRCPICFWRPLRSSRWTCWDCDAPEYFYGGCGTEWNTFETAGKCPTCFHQWKWTSCLSCWGWSPHDSWYEVEDDA